MTANGKVPPRPGAGATSATLVCSRCTEPLLVGGGTYLGKAICQACRVELDKRPKPAPATLASVYAACKHCHDTTTKLRVLDLCETCYLLLVIEPYKAEARRLEESLVIVRDNEFKALALLGMQRKLAAQVPKPLVYKCNWCKQRFGSMLRLTAHITDNECKGSHAPKQADKPRSPMPRRKVSLTEAEQDEIV